MSVRKDFIVSSFYLYFLFILFIIPNGLLAMESVDSKDSALFFMENHINTVFSKNGIYESSDIAYSISSETITEDSIIFDGNFSIIVESTAYSGSISWNSVEVEQEDGSMLATIIFTVSLNNGTQALNVDYSYNEALNSGVKGENVAYQLGSWTLTSSKTSQTTETDSTKTTNINIASYLNGTEYQTTATHVETIISSAQTHVVTTIEEYQVGGAGTTTRTETEYDITFESSEDAAISYTQYNIYKNGTLTYEMASNGIENSIYFSEDLGHTYKTNLKLQDIVEDESGVSFSLTINFYNSALDISELSLSSATLLGDTVSTEGFESENANHIKNIVYATEIGMAGVISGGVATDILITAGASLGAASSGGLAAGVVIGAIYKEWVDSGRSLSYITTGFNYYVEGLTLQAQAAANLSTLLTISGPTLGQWQKIFFAFIILSLGCRILSRKEGLSYES